MTTFVYETNATLRLSVEDIPDFVARRVGGRCGWEMVKIDDAVGRTLTEDVRAPMQLPPFDHAAVDGYALALDHIDRLGTAITVKSDGRAGANQPPDASGAVRIFSGAPVPENVASVVMQEHVESGSKSIVLSGHVRKGANIRRRGEDVDQNELVMASGVRIDARHVALLAALGVGDVQVAQRPRVALIANGSELAIPGANRRSYQVYDSNSSMAAAFFAAHGCKLVVKERFTDDPEALMAALLRLAGTVELVVTSGGMASGDKDLLRSTVASSGGSWHCAGVKMKPGKPVALGTVCGTTVLGLPDNPFAALVALTLFAPPILTALDGRATVPAFAPAGAAFDLYRKPGRAEFFPGRIIGHDNGRPMIDRLGKGGSARLRPLCDAEGLGFIEADRMSIAHDDAVSFAPFQSLL
ncbi:MAG: molybdopterin molybdotransferase MoeA [Devosia sp.]